MIPLTYQYYVLVGNYGSGKTELSLSLVRRLKKQSRGKVALVDLDIVNPYFRSAEKKELLESEGIEVKMPSFALTGVDIPALPAEIQSVFEPGRYAHVVIDVGGDDTGAAALGRYAPYIAPRRERMCVPYVLNPYRPLTGTAQAAGELFELICQRARLKPDYLVNNTNLQTQTTAEELVRGHVMVKALSDKLGVPIGLVTGEKRLYSALPDEMRQLFFPITPLMRPEWMEEP
ncbi:MAG: hypothetical protein EOM69_03530 [Clostridia bacterium]|nr:hypothetical protein [Clostridia bacterium]